MLAAAMSVAVTMPVESVNAEAAIGHATARCDETSIRAARDFTQQAGTAIAPPHKPRRYRADRRAPHHGQKDAARAFHWAASGQIFKGRVEFVAGNLGWRAAARQVKRGYFAAWSGAHLSVARQPPKQNARKVPRSSRNPRPIVTLNACNL
jgi:hypothetical protein